MVDDEAGCGRELAASAEVPEAIARLFAHVTLNLRSHAAWVGTGTPAARAEHDALHGVAEDYQALASAAEKAAEHMRTLHALEPAPHDPAAFDREAFARWMRTKVTLQRALAELLIAHASRSEAALVLR